MQLLPCFAHAGFLIIVNIDKVVGIIGIIVMIKMMISYLAALFMQVLSFQITINSINQIIGMIFITSTVINNVMA